MLFTSLPANSTITSPFLSPALSAGLPFDTFTISPHSAWYSEQAAVEMNRKVAEEAMRFIKGEPLHYPLNTVK